MVRASPAGALIEGEQMVRDDSTGPLSELAHAAAAPAVVLSRPPSVPAATPTPEAAAVPSPATPSHVDAERATFAR